MKRIKKILLQLLGLTIVVLSLHGCQDEEEIVSEKNKTDYSITKISLTQLTKEIPENSTQKNKLIELFTPKKNSVYSTVSPVLEKQNKYILNKKDIIKITRNNIITYTIQVVPQQKSLSFLNLVIYFNEKGTLTGSKLLEYTPDLQWFNDTSQPFIGSIKIVHDNFENLEEILQTGSLTSRCPAQIYGNWVCSNGNPHAPGTVGCVATSYTYEYTIAEDPTCSGGGGGVDGTGGSGTTDPLDGLGGSTTGDGSFNPDGGGSTTPNPSGVESVTTLAELLNLTTEEEAWLNNPLHKTQKNLLVEFLVNNKTSEEAKKFARKAIRVYMENPNAEIDFDDKIINNLTGKAKCVYDKLTKSSTGFKNMIQKFDGDFPVSHLKFVLEDLETSRGQTWAPDNYTNTSSPDYVITIALNNNSTSQGVDYRPNLMTAKTIAHEVIHAEMYRKLLSVIDNGGTISGVTRQDILNALNGNFPGMYDYYRRHKNWQHQQMATHYRETIADILQEFDNNQNSRQLYLDIAWEGLIYERSSNAISIWVDLAQTEKDRIKNTIKNYIETNKNQNCQ
ncbi:hypothetical protein ACQY1Q_14570 [Tenacibaculum sp. TC6]|uniref:hypothetical protein n=1 Tax=Tenacibaculum sp. TC6 TaxID=3423223 RepID=UPI003D364B92